MSHTLLYADDLVLLTNSAEDMQLQLCKLRVCKLDQNENKFRKNQNYGCKKI